MYSLRPSRALKCSPTANKVPMGGISLCMGSQKCIGIEIRGYSDQSACSIWGVLYGYIYFIAIVCFPNICRYGLVCSASLPWVGQSLQVLTEYSDNSEYSTLQCSYTV